MIYSRIHGSALAPRSAIGSHARRRSTPSRRQRAAAPCRLTRPHGGQAPALSPPATHSTTICPRRVNTSRDSTVIVGRSILTEPPSAATRTDRWASSQAGLPPTALRRKCRPPWSHPEALSYQCERDRAESRGTEVGAMRGTLMGMRTFQCAQMAACAGLQG